MEYLLSEITEEMPHPLLPPIFGVPYRKKKKRLKKAKKRKPRILIDLNLREKASSIINSDSPQFNYSKYM